MQTGDGEDEFAVFAERCVFVLETLAFETESAGTDHVGGETGEDLFGVEGFAGGGVMVDGCLEAGGAFD